MKVLFVAVDDFEDLELFYPYFRLKEEEHEVLVASDRKGHIKGKHGYPITIDVKFDEVDIEKFDALVIPGGKSPERVRLNDAAVEICRNMFLSGKPVASICHGAQVLISAQVLEGRTGTCVASIKDDLINAGAEYRDQEVIVDGNWVSSRHPGDLHAWMREFLKLLKKAR